MSSIIIYCSLLVDLKYSLSVLSIQSDVIRKPQGQIELNACSQIERGDGKQTIQVLAFLICISASIYSLHHPKQHLVPVCIALEVQVWTWN